MNPTTCAEWGFRCWQVLETSPACLEMRGAAGDHCSGGYQADPGQGAHCVHHEQTSKPGEHNYDHPLLNTLLACYSKDEHPRGAH